MSDGRFINGLTSDGGTYSHGSSILTYIAAETIINRHVRIKLIAAHGRFANGSTSDGGPYSHGSSILTYVAVEVIVETELC
jgi:hypothetical protein